MNSNTETSSAKDANVIRGVTLSVVLEKYFFSKRIRSSTETVYRSTINRCLSDWLELPITAITKDMVVERHKKLGNGTSKGTSGEATANLSMRILRALLNFAADEYEIDGEPALTVNPVQRLSRNESWYRIQPRETVIPDHKLSAGTKP